MHPSECQTPSGKRHALLVARIERESNAYALQAQMEARSYVSAAPSRNRYHVESIAPPVQS